MIAGIYINNIRQSVIIQSGEQGSTGPLDLMRIRWDSQVV